MKLKRTFVQGKMNKDIDERLLPSGQYPHAENIRVANTDSSDMGAIENVRGNEQLTDLGLTNAVTIGAFSDSSNQKLYWFVTSDEKDMVLEYDTLNMQLNVLLESSNPDGVLNFNKNYLITGVNKLVNEDFNNDLLLWTDDINPPRKINIERAKTYGLDGFIEDDISLIKKPPRFAPSVDLSYSSTGLGENNLENKFLSFAYRYKYLDGEYSALSSFTNYQFAPEQFNLDFQTMENNGMVNQFNALRINFDTGDKRVTDIELVYKESNSNTIFLIERFNKQDEGWIDNEERTFEFTNSKRYIALPEDELFRQFDNVPRLAKAQEIIGNRVVFGNYVEGYDLVNIFGQNINIDYNVSVINKNLSGEEIPVSFSNSSVTDGRLTIDLTGISLIEGGRIVLDLTMFSSYDEGEFEGDFDFILNRDYADAQDLAEDPDFIYFIESVLTNAFLQGYTATEPDDSEVTDEVPFNISGYTTNTITITAPSIEYTIDDTPDDTSDNPANTHIENSNWAFNQQSTAFFREIAVDSSLKTNRSYEVGIIYLDEYGRATTVLTDDVNTVYIPQDFSTFQNKLLVSINHTPPYWADRYKLVVKQNKLGYHTVYTSVFYEDGIFRWVKLEGANKDKVREGDTLIVKSDLSGVVNELIKVRVLEVVSKDEDFIEGNVFTDGSDIIEQSGLYMKIKPVGFDMNYNGNTLISASDYNRAGKRRQRGDTQWRVNTVVTLTPAEYSNFSDGGNWKKPVTLIKDALNNYDASGAYVSDLEIGVGSRISIKLRNYESDGYNEIYERDFIVQDTYPNFEDWWNAEVVDLGNKEPQFDWIFGRSASGELCFLVQGEEAGTSTERSKLTTNIDIFLVEGIVIFETEPEDSDIDIYYETEQTFEIIDNLHQANVEDQSSSSPAIVEMDFFNCYVQGNGAESYRYKDAFSVGTNDIGETIPANYLNIDLRPTSTSIEEYKEVRRYADLTYSEPYNENNNINGLNEFNLAKANFKEDIDKKYGYIQKLHSRDTDLLVFQEDKVSKVLFGKDLLLNADGSSNVSSIEDVLGQQVAYTGEYGISRNPESFSYDGYYIYFTDAKRGAVMRLGNDGLTEISMYGLRQFFKDQFRDAIDNKKLGSIDPYNDQYVLHPSSEIISPPVEIDCSSSIVRSNFTGDVFVTIDYGILIGQAGFSYNTNGVPVRFDVEWDGNTYSTGFVGDPSYNDELSDLGLPAVVGSGTGTFTFDKTSANPTKATIRVYAPLCDTSFTLSGNCIVPQTLRVINVILNDEFDEGLTMKSRYRWSADGYISPFKNYNSIFETGELDIFDEIIGAEGSENIPLTGSTVFLESYDGFTETAEFLEENQLGYLVSNTLYTSAQFQDIVDNATFPTLNTQVLASGDISNNISFTFDRPNNEQYLYLIWDYRNPELIINQDTKIRIYFDSSGSMDSSLVPLQVMRDTLLRDRLLPFYNNDNALYDANVTVIEQGDERTMDMLNMNGDTPTGNVIVLVFQDESSPYGVGSTGATPCPRTAQFDTDLATLRARLVTFAPDYYRGVIFQVDGFPPFKQFVQNVENGTDCYGGSDGLSDKIEFNYKYDITDGGTPQYYLDQIVNALTELGYVL